MGRVSKPVMAKLGKRYGVLQEAAQSLETGTILTPVTNADELVKIPNIATVGPVAISATGKVNVVSVPKGKRWTVYAAEILLSTGTYTFNAIYATAKDGSTACTMYYTATAATRLVTNGMAPFILNEDMQLGVEVAAFTGAGNATFFYAYVEEDII